MQRLIQYAIIALFMSGGFLTGKYFSSVFKTSRYIAPPQPSASKTSNNLEESSVESLLVDLNTRSATSAERYATLSLLPTSKLQMLISSLYSNSWPTDTDRSTLAIAFELWASRDPEGLIVWMSKRPPGRFVPAAISAAFTALSNSDQKRAIQLAAKLSTDSEANLAWPAILQNQALNPQEIASLILGEVGHFRNLPAPAVSQFFEQWARKDRPAALEYAMALQDVEQKKTIIGDIVEIWGKSEIDTCIKWIERSNFPNISKNGLKYSAISSLAMSDPELASTFLPKLTGLSERDALVRKLAATWVERDSAAAMAWLDSIQSDSARSLAANTMVSTIMKNDPQSALELARDIPGNQLRDELFQDYVRRRVSFDPESALEWIDTISNPETKEKCVSAALGELAVVKPQEALNYLFNTNAGFDRSSVLSSVLSGVARNPSEIPSVVEWAVQNLDVSQRQEIAAAAVAKYGNTLPKEYADLLNTLTGGTN